MKRKVHVFLGAPPEAEIRLDPQDRKERLDQLDRLSNQWSHLDLCWRDGQLRPSGGPGGLHQSDEFFKNHNLPTISDVDQTHKPMPGVAGPPETDDLCSASLHGFLDSCFPTAQQESEAVRAPGSGPGAAKLSLSMQTQYLSTWTLSQALVLRANHIDRSATSPLKTQPTVTLNSSLVQSGSSQTLIPSAPNSGSSNDLFSSAYSSPSAKYGGVTLKATPDGVLCSQESSDLRNKSPDRTPNTSNTDSPPKSPTRLPTKSPPCRSPEVCKRPPTPPPMTNQNRFPNNSLTNPNKSPTNTPINLSPSEKPVVFEGSCSGPTLLERCNRPGMRVSVLVVAVHPCFLKEIQVRSGPSAGNRIPLATIVVTDQSAVEMKVVLWRWAAFWAVTVYPGDALFITGLCVRDDKWRSEVILQSTFSCKMLHLGQITGPAPPTVSRQVNSDLLACLCKFVSRCRPLLLSLPRRSLQDLTSLQYVSRRSLKVNTLVHALLKVSHTQLSPVWRSEAESTSKAALQRRAVVAVQQADGQQGVLLLWNSAVDWISHFNRNKGAVWDLQVLLVRASQTTDLPELHTTPWSSLRALDPNDRCAVDFHLPVKTGGGCLELDVDTLLSQKFSGEVTLKVQLLSFTFLDSHNAPQPVLDCSSPLDVIMATMNEDVTYIGCGRCSAELVTDSNHIYEPCYLCLPHRSVRSYYRTSQLTVGGRGQTQLCLKVPPEVLQQILQIHPESLQRSSAPGSAVKNLQVASQRLLLLLSLPRRTFTLTVRSYFLTDHNSETLIEELTLLSLQTQDGL